MTRGRTGRRGEGRVDQSRREPVRRSRACTTRSGFSQSFDGRGQQSSTLPSFSISSFRLRLVCATESWANRTLDLRLGRLRRIGPCQTDPVNGLQRRRKHVRPVRSLWTLLVRLTGREQATNGKYRRVYNRRMTQLTLLGLSNRLKVKCRGLIEGTSACERCTLQGKACTFNVRLILVSQTVSSR